MKNNTKKEAQTLVKFLIHPSVDSEVFAYFPQLNYNKRLYGTQQKTGYAHMGQHTAINKRYAEKSTEATQEQYADLYKELQGLGYNLRVLNTEPQYKVVKVFRVSRRRQVLARGLSKDEAKALVNAYPDSNTSMVVFLKQ